MQAVLSTIGKFHTLDLARQLYRLDAFKMLFSGYPRFKLSSAGLPKEKIETFPYLHAPLVRCAPFLPAAWRSWEWQDKVWFDRYVARRLPECDVFCGLSGSALNSGLRAKALGAKYICDRGSSHIRFQDRILREEHDRQGIPFAGIDPRVIAREEAEYQAADLITVPSSFAFDTFVNCGIDPQKMRLSPYGVDLGAFYRCQQKNKNNHEDRFVVLFVGAVCVRKGVRYLVEAFRKLECRRKNLILVGAISPDLRDSVAQWRRDQSISVLGPVPQPRLKEIMSGSDVMVLPSVEEGLALVQAQAMACGCPVISSENTGARDLFTDGREGFIVPIRDSDAIADRLQLLADNLDLKERMSAAAQQRVNGLGGWNQYGDNMHRIFSECLSLPLRVPIALGPFSAPSARKIVG